MQMNDNIIFGEHEWLVLHIDNNKALIVTERIIEHRSYHDEYSQTNLNYLTISDLSVSDIKN
jgi:hypothetical protein